MPAPLTPHLLIPFAACSASAWLPTMQALPQGGLKRLGQLLHGMKLAHADTQAEESLSPPHERALARALALADPGTPDGLLPWAAYDAARHLPAGVGKAWAWITPCHWAVAKMHATLTDPAMLALREDESRALLALMQPYFATDGITLHYLAELGPGRWLAEGELFRGLPTASLDRVLARNVDAWLPDAAQAAPLRRLQNEMQMLLYTHATNDEREARRQLPVNSFWISGSGNLPSAFSVEENPSITLPHSLAQAVFKEDWAGYAQAWQALDAGEITGLLARQRAGESVRLTLCGECSTQTFESQRASLGSRISSLFSPTRPLDVLKQL
ncbi:MAG: hypothetical protein ACWA6Y_00275 [Polaromonas sp.]